jgi:cytochrome c553
LFCALLSLSAGAVAEDDLMHRPPWAACEYCHGLEGRIDSPDVPAIAGQSASYIAKQLADFRAGRRVSPQGQMRSATLLLDAEDDDGVARHFASREPSALAASADASDGPGARLFWFGGPEIAACAGCHAPTQGILAPAFPRLFGLNEGYLVRQLQAFRDGTRDNDPDGVMRGQAATLTDEQIEALAGYLSG